MTTPPFSLPARCRALDLAAAFVLAWAPLLPARTPPHPDVAVARQPDGSGEVVLTGDPALWHTVTLTVDGPFAHERDLDPNPFTDFRLTVTFTHAAEARRYVVPGYFATDGRAAESSAEAGTRWRAHFTPDRTGEWQYAISFVRGRHVALSTNLGSAIPGCDGRAGHFVVRPSDKSGRDFRAHGRLQYVGKHHLRFAGSGQYFLKAGPDAPENLLAYADFDGTRANRNRSARPGEARPAGTLKTWQPHVRDWRPGDPTWKGDRGKGLVGALDYLASKDLNVVSFLPYNAGGDGDDVWPFVERDAKLHYDVSKLDQWGIVFEHAQHLGLALHFKLQETEIDDLRVGHDARDKAVPTSLDGGRLGPERRLYCRELVARFAHLLALQWNIGEENTQSTSEINDMVDYLRDIDPYRHHVVIHTYPDWQERVYEPLLGSRSRLTGVSLQNPWNHVHRRTVQWIDASAQAGQPWVVANDEQNPADFGVPPDPGYPGLTGNEAQGHPAPTIDDIRKATLWGNLLGGGAGVEYYFGYRYPQSDLTCEDWRSRDRSWDACRIALAFFRDHAIPFWEMTNADALVGNPTHDNSRYCLAQPGRLYLVYLPQGGLAELDLAGTTGPFEVRWFNPRTGGPLAPGNVVTLQAGARTALGPPPSEPDLDWLIVVRRP